VPHHLSVAEALLDTHPDCRLGLLLECFFRCASSAEVAWVLAHAERAAALMGSMTSVRRRKHRRRLRAILTAVKHHEASSSLQTRALPGHRSSIWPTIGERAGQGGEKHAFGLRTLRKYTHDDRQGGQTATIAVFQPTANVSLEQANSELSLAIAKALRRAASLGRLPETMGTAHYHAFFDWQANEAELLPAAACEEGTGAVRELRNSLAFGWLGRQLSKTFDAFDLLSSSVPRPSLDARTVWLQRA
jgi:hypothetical protein